MIDDHSAEQKHGCNAALLLLLLLMLAFMATIGTEAGFSSLPLLKPKHYIHAGCHCVARIFGRYRQTDVYINIVHF